jgi:hypothetical protein
MWDVAADIDNDRDIVALWTRSRSRRCGIELERCRVGGLFGAPGYTSLSCTRLFSYPTGRIQISDGIDTSYVSLLISPSHELLEGAAFEVPDMNDKTIGTLAWFRTHPFITC